MHGPLRLTYALLANYMAKCQMSSGPYGPIFIKRRCVKYDNQCVVIPYCCSESPEKIPEEMQYIAIVVSYLYDNIINLRG